MAHLLPPSLLICSWVKLRLISRVSREVDLLCYGHTPLPPLEVRWVLDLFVLRSILSSTRFTDVYLMALLSHTRILL